MSRSRSWCLLVLLLLVATAPSVSADDTRRLSSSRLAPDAAHEVWALAGSTARGHLVRVGPDSPARLRVVQAQGGLAGRETPSSICRRTRGCRAAVNGDYFTGAAPVGGAVVRGRMLRSPSSRHEQLSLEPLRATTQGFGADGWAGTVNAPDGTVLRLHAVNRGTIADQTALWTADAGARTPACSCLEVVLSEVDGRAVGVLDKPVRVRAVRRAGGGTALSPGTSVLAANGLAAEQLALATDTSAGRPWTITLTTAQPTRENVGAHPVLLREGRTLPRDDADPALRDPHPRTLVAWDGAGTSWIGVLDGRQPGGPGTTAAELVGFVRARGATDAVLLDGGGSSTLASSRGPLNRPSDGAERAVANAVVLVWDPPPRDSRRAAARTATAPVPVDVAAPAPARGEAVVAVPARASSAPAPRPAPRAPQPPAPVPADGAGPVVPAAPGRVPAAAAATPAAPVTAPTVPAAPAGHVVALPVPVRATAGDAPGPERAAALLLAAVLLAWTATTWDVVRRSGPAPR